MKIKCFPKRKLNVRISKTKIKCAILGFPKIAAFWGNPEKKWSKFSKKAAPPSANATAQKPPPRNLTRIRPQKTSTRIARTQRVPENAVSKRRNQPEFANNCKNQQNVSDKKQVEIRERCKEVHCVDLGESFPTSIYLQTLVSIQPRTSQPASRERATQSLPKISQTLKKQVRKT